MHQKSINHAAIAARLLSMTGPLTTHQEAVVLDTIDGMTIDALRAAAQDRNAKESRLTLKEAQAVDRAVRRLANTKLSPTNAFFTQHLKSITETDC